MKSIKQLTYVFFALAILEIIGVFFSSEWSKYVCKPLMYSILIFLYNKVDMKGSKEALYYTTFLFAILFHTFFIFKDQNLTMLTYGLYAFNLYYCVNIIIVKKMLKKVSLLPVLIAITPFMIITGCETYELRSYFDGVWISVILAGSLLAVFFGFALYNYFLKISRKSLLLLVSASAIVVSAFTFALDHFYYQLLVLKILTILGNTTSLYTFYRFMIVEEVKENSNDTAMNHMAFHVHL